jgi:hypothetical protein
MGIMR